MAKWKQNGRELSERIKLVIEIFGVLSALVVAYFAYQAYRLQKLSTEPNVAVVDKSRSYDSSWDSSSDEWKDNPPGVHGQPVDTCRYDIKLSNNGGASTFVTSVAYKIWFGEKSAELEFNERTVGAAYILVDDGYFSFLGYFTENVSSEHIPPLQLPAHSPVTLKVSLDIRYPEAYDYPIFTATVDPNKRTFLKVDITIRFPDIPPLVINDVDCTAYIHK
jgi:hypothetical protein